MPCLKCVALALFAGAVIAKFIYVVVKTVRITVLKIDPPMAGFDSDPATEVALREIPEVDGARVQEIPAIVQEIAAELPIS